MKTLIKIRNQLSSGNFDFTRHAFKRSVERNISDSEIKEAGKNIKIIENYPDDKYSPSCLLSGFTRSKRPLHIQVYLADTDTIKIITIYEPDEKEWTDNFSRRR